MSAGRASTKMSGSPCPDNKHPHYTDRQACEPYKVAGAVRARAFWKEMKEMARGETSPLGSERVAQNGYHYIKTPQGWRLKHHIIAEKTLGRPIDTKIETVKFLDRNRTNFDPANIVVEPKRNVTVASRKARIESRIEELQAQLHELEDEAQ